MSQYLSPGVYIQDSDDIGPHLIEAVKTNIAAFIGFSERAEKVEKKNGQELITDLLNKPQRVESWSEYEELFGGFVEGAYMPYAVYGYFQNNHGVSPCYVISVYAMNKAEATLFGDDGKPLLKVCAKQAGREGARLRVRVEVPKNDEQQEESKPKTPAQVNFNLLIEKESPSGRWEKKEKIEDVTIEDETSQIHFKRSVPETIELIIIDRKKEKAIQSPRPYSPRPQQQQLRLTKKFLPHLNLEELKGQKKERAGLAILGEIDEITILCIPDLMMTRPGKELNETMVANIQGMMVAHCEAMEDKVAILDAPPNLKPKQIKGWQEKGYESSYAALYYPWIEINDPLTNRTIKIPPSGHIAGIWSRSDQAYGVHKAPANEVILGATGLAYHVSAGEQESLNPNGINCIRFLPGLGIRVWGARTLSNSREWRYINVRRLFNFVKKSIENGTQWMTFEPNNHQLWARVRREVINFLTREVWEKGMLAGASPQEAFFVKCDEELNPSDSRDQGKLRIDIGLAPIRPAEFIIFRLSQTAGPNAE